MAARPHCDPIACTNMQFPELLAADLGMNNLAAVDTRKIDPHARSDVREIGNDRLQRVAVLCNREYLDIVRPDVNDGPVIIKL